MDTKALIKNLRALFSNENKAEKKYAKVWLNRIIALGHYDTKRFKLNVQYDQPISQEYQEKNRILNLVFEKIEGSLGRISGVGVHYFEDHYYHIQPDDILVYEEDE
jgi:hypothetical protein